MIEVLGQKPDRLVVFLLVFLVWVGIYLPALGGTELKGEEGRRILPAVTMLKTGNWIVPHVGGVAYYKKPPLINWLVAGSFTILGRYDEQAARIPSVLFVLAFVSLVVWLPGSWLPLGARWVGAVVFLTTVAIVEKGRLIEIEAVYIALTSMATFCWLSAWMRKSSAWQLWCVPSLFLAAGMMTKGPVHLFFYYVTVICVLAYSKRLRALFSIQHAVAVVLSLGLPAIWAYLAWRQVAGSEMTGGMSGEMVARMMPWNVDWGLWAKNVLKSLLILLPWICFVPVLWQRQFVAHLPQEHQPAFKGARLGLLLGFALVTLIPGNSSRYALPVVGLGSVLLGWVLASVSPLPDGGKPWRMSLLIGLGLAGISAVIGLVLVDRGIWGAVVAVISVCLAIVAVRYREKFKTSVSLSVLTALLVVVLAVQYAFFLVPIIRQGEARRPLGDQINVLLPEDETLYVFKPGYQAFLFYVRPPLDYIVEPDQIDHCVRFLLIRKPALDELRDTEVLRRRSPVERCSFTYRHKGDFVLLELAPVADEVASSALGRRILLGSTPAIDQH